MGYSMGSGDAGLCVGASTMRVVNGGIRVRPADVPSRNGSYIQVQVKHVYVYHVAHAILPQPGCVFFSGSR